MQNYVFILVSSSAIKYIKAIQGRVSLSFMVFFFCMLLNAF